MARRKRFASIIERKGVFYVRYTPAAGGNRRKFSTGTSDPVAARAIAENVDAIIPRRANGRPMQGQVQSWLDDLPRSNPALFERLVAHGLADPLEPADSDVVTLGAFVSRFIREPRPPSSLAPSPRTHRRNGCCSKFSTDPSLCVTSRKPTQSRFATICGHASIAGERLNYLCRNPRSAGGVAVFGKCLRTRSSYA